MKKFPVLKTQRLILKEISEADTDFIVKLRSNPDVYLFFTSPHIIDKAEHLNWYKNRYIFDDNRFDLVAFDVNSERIGVFGIKRNNEVSAEAEISYILSPEYYGKGYAAEAINELIIFCKEEWNCSDIIAEIHVDNQKSISFIRKLGFHLYSTENKFDIYKRQI